MEAVDDSAVGSTSHSDTIRAKIGIVDGADVPPFAPPLLLLLLSVRADVRADIPSRVREEKKAAVFVGVGAESRCRGAGVVDGCGPTGISGPCAGELDSGDGVRTGSDVDAFAPAGSSWGAKVDTGAAGAGVVEVLTCGTPLVPGVRRGSPEGVAVGVRLRRDRGERLGPIGADAGRSAGEVGEASGRRLWGCGSGRDRL